MHIARGNPDKRFGHRDGSAANKRSPGVAYSRGVASAMFCRQVDLHLNWTVYVKMRKMER